MKHIYFYRQEMKQRRAIIDLVNHTQMLMCNPKVGLSFQKKNCFIRFNESHMKMMKNAFYFIIRNALFVLKIFNFLS